MSKMAAEHDAINLSQGFPNFPVDTVLTDIVIRLAKIMFIINTFGGLSSFIVKHALLVKILPKNSLPEIEILVTAGLHKPYLQLFKLW
jgi:methionine aminotransferase